MATEERIAPGGAGEGVGAMIRILRVAVHRGGLCFCVCHALDHGGHLTPSSICSALLPTSHPHHNTANDVKSRIW